MYYYSEPPYFLLVAGLLVGMACGSAFDTTLKQLVREWAKNRSTRTLMNLQGTQLFVPFLGIAVGVCVFLAAGLEIFGFPFPVSYVISLPLTVLSSWLIWYQLGKLLVQLDRGGSQALDLDSIN
ncbi:hypothetical protein [Microcoleus sp. FACHB-672]|uniref:hypothetical protein n=1 Tax=Microcoleus sp. FACHB-672 TaxID=2692825 RepID=UPI0016822FFE|nr:hypothetical protein [Microcoleus sp. FACHB-672]MBD2043015.1 hypothetical protein [Microcoleus sp. FACHB-672]